MPKESTNEDSAPIVKMQYFVPEYGITVVANSPDEAIKAAAKQVNKES